ncbi:phosphatase PAP2 family protein [Brachybacterium sp. DNPG3]
MAADTRISPVPGIDATLARERLEAPSKGWIARLTSARALGIAFVALFLVAAGPFQRVDVLLAERWLRRLAPDLVWFAQNVLDRIAGQAVCLPVLAAIAIVLARRRRSWRPIVLALCAEAAFYLGVGGLKVITARGVSYRHDPDFFAAGFLAAGSKGISFPSGHAAESILIYGMGAYLIARYSGVADRTIRLLTAGVALLAVNSVTVSFLLGWHWTSDLIGGILAGGFFLRLITDLDRRALLRQLDRLIGAPDTCVLSADCSLRR